MEIRVSDRGSVVIKKKNLRMLRKIAKKYKKSQTEIVKEWIESEYQILESDIRTYGDFAIK